MTAGVRPWAEHLPPSLDPAELDLLAGGTLPAVWTELAAADPDAPAIHADGRWHSRGELDASARRHAAALSAAGVAAGDRVLFNCAPSLRLVIDHVAALYAGTAVVPTNPGYSPRELDHIVGDARPAVALCDDPERRSELAARHPGLPVLASIGELADAGSNGRLRLEPDAPAMVVYTSGTTGAPKGAVLSHANLLAGTRSLLPAWRWMQEDRLVLALPLFHVHGLGVGLHGTLTAGASAVLLERFSPEAVLDAAAAHDATLFFGVPTMYARLVEHDRVGELSRLRLCVSGSAPLPPDLFARFEEATGHTPLERYGMTETLMNLSNPHDGARKPGSVGFPLPGVEMRLEGGGREGEILFRGPNVFGGYWERPEVNAEAFTSDGYFRTGDIGAVDEDGYVAIVGRTKELIISGGYNVYPREVEEALADCPGVGEVAVAGIPSEEWGEIVTAYVVPSGEPPDLESMRLHVADRLARYKQPRLLRLVEELPRNAMGKIVRAELESAPAIEPSHRR